MLSPCSHNYGIPFIWSSRWLVVEPISSILSPPWLMLNINLVLETFISIIFMSHSWRICWMKQVTFSDSRAFWCKLLSWIRESLFLLLWNHPKSVMHVRRILWSVRLIIFIPYVYPSTPSHWLICSRRRSILIRANPDLWKNFDILADGSQPELGSVLL